MKLFLSCKLIGLIMIGSLSTPLLAEDNRSRTWELGVGAGALIGPDYRGSDEYRNYAAPIPYLVYHGKYIRSDRDGVRGNFLHTDNYEFTLSANVIITPDSDKSTLREDMPELGSTIELGPSITIRLSGETLTQGWQLHLPWRGVFAIDDDESGYIGHVFQPQLGYRHSGADWSFAYRAGVSIASEDYHAHYYSVASEYATENRPEFTAKGGYSGWHNQVSLSKRFDIFDEKTRLALFLRYDNLDHTRFNKSPLVVTHSAWRGGIAFIWVIQ